MAFGSPLHSQSTSLAWFTSFPVSLCAFCNETKTAIPTRDLVLWIVQTRPKAVQK
ncbi:hypothetical protein JOE21_001506 [Desmospora profundinema]|uniref:Uncharacterized protein n=1 Tax=Desmospora profundinema TaxID=1571184 RepID=A0ABU1IL61_9BACL|nr:hypothetical protein [Desmospora profundinema]